MAFRASRPSGVASLVLAAVAVRLCSAATATHPQPPGGCAVEDLLTGRCDSAVVYNQDESQLMSVQLMQTKHKVTKKPLSRPAATSDAADGVHRELADPTFLLNYSREERSGHASAYQSARASTLASLASGQTSKRVLDESLAQATAREGLASHGERRALRAASDDDPPEPGHGPAAEDATLQQGADGLMLDGLVHPDAVGDIYAFAAAAGFNVFCCSMILITFSFFRRAWPQIYAHNAQSSFELRSPNERPGCGWLWYASSTDTAKWTDRIGLDCAMMIEFLDLCIRILLMIGIPIICIQGPLNYEFGGNAAGKDIMSWLSLSNVDRSHPWLYYVHAGTVWYVVFVVQWNIYRAQEMFLKRRVNWLKSLPEERAHTILIEGIPEEDRSDENLRMFFETMMGEGSVEQVYLMKDTRTLAANRDQCRRIKHRMMEAEVAERKAMQSNNHSQEQFEREEKNKLQHEYDTLELESDAESRNIWEQSQQPGANLQPYPVNLSSGFVKFKKRKTAQMALSLSISADSAEWATQVPPDAEDIIWADLTSNPSAQAIWDALGVALVVVLYFAYFPLVVAVASLATTVHMGQMQPLWEGLAPTMGLQVVVSFLPAILQLIFRTCFAVKANAWSQMKLQVWYFWFQIVFVILVFAIGDSVTDLVEIIIVDPTAIFGLLAETLPDATHFYMNFQVLQWTVHCLALLRLGPLWRFTGLQALYKEDEAIALAEPEDQNFQGIGSRCARNTINMLIAIIYGTITPGMNLLALISFMICRFVYGYLVPFAETRKADLGGLLWVKQLEHLFVGLVIYSVLMTAVLIGRSATIFPGLIAATSVFYVLWSLDRFGTEFNWELLPFEEVAKGVKDAARDERRKSKHAYVQPGMEKEFERALAKRASQEEKSSSASAALLKSGSSSDRRGKDRLPDPRRAKDTSR